MDKQAILEYIGRKAKDFRTNVLHITQSELSEKWGISQPHISRFESGQTDSAYILLIYISEGLIC